MSEIALGALRKLLRAEESARINKTERTVSLRMNRHSYPAYLNISAFDEKQRAHAVFADAQRCGAVRLEWERFAGKEGQMERILLADGASLAEFLGVIPLWDQLETAERALLDWSAEFPAVQRILDAWCSGKTVRGKGPDDVENFVAALKVLAYLRGNPDRDFVLRLLSVRLFGDSKRLEQLSPHLDALSAETGVAAGDPAEIFAGLGILRAPQPMLLAGGGVVRMSDGTRIPVPFPYVGVPPEAVAAYEPRVPCEYVLTVENLTPFYEVARGIAGQPRGLVIYTAGMPSPAWRRAFGALVDGFDESARMLHWGDIDSGGFRIARRLTEDLRLRNRSLFAHAMNPAKFLEEVNHREADTARVREMQRIAVHLGWSDIADALEQRPWLVEQEAIEVTLPNSG